MTGKTFCEKMFVDVKSTPDSYGWNIPYELTYNDEKFEIIDPQRGMKLFNNAVRFKCEIDGRAIRVI